MNGQSFLIDALILLAAVVFIVPLAHKAKLGAVLGYLLAGLIVGPGGLKLITDTQSLAHVSEWGVVFLLFVIGMELEPKRLWQMRVAIFGMGSLQIALVAVFTMLLGMACGFTWNISLMVGLGFALSSTAIGTQILKGRNLLSTPGGNSAFAVLLFQDVAVIPILALFPLLAGELVEVPGHAHAPWWQIIVAVLAIAVAGTHLLRPVLRMVASTHLREVFTALSLILVLGLAALMQSLGVSMALGAFVGGVLLATSEYRHAIETDLEPFKGLLLGLFFMSVGMSINLETIASHPSSVLSLVAALLAIKIAAHLVLTRIFRVSAAERPIFVLTLSQGGEFAFVLFGAAALSGMLSAQQLALLSAAVALSMAATPVLFLLYDRWWAPRLSRLNQIPDEVIENTEPEVLIAGFGRVGQIIGRLLYAQRIRATVLDHDPEQIEFLRGFGFKVHYGDATRLDLLENAGARTAKVLVIAVDSVEDSLKLVDLAKTHFPHLRVIVRARNMSHVYELMDRGVEIFERETFESSLRMGTEVLKSLRWNPYQAVRASHQFRHHNERMIKELHALRKNQSQMLSAAKEAREQLAEMFAGEEARRQRQQDGWGGRGENPAPQRSEEITPG
ncbi:MAG: glutathione-regulated potassium-efflux system protein KefC [Bdellovibrionaceae bacterium]|nr:glutathione-regulated potassium-efflux system protein KefC [Pseudobdellovibrionaceae bacterium]